MISGLGRYFREIAFAHADRVALRYDGRSVTYRELDALSDQIVRFLRDNDIGRHDVVGLFSSKTPIVYASMLACLKIGVIYTNIDEENPKVRLERIFATARPKVLIADHQPAGTIKASADALDIPLHYLQEETLAVYAVGEMSLSYQIIASDPAYIMFTSGSTGVPKGVLISHGNLFGLIDWSRQRYDITPEDVFAQVSPLYFDNSVFDFYTALFSGASLAPIKKEVLRHPLEIVRSVDRLRCTIFFSVPSLLIYLTTMRVLTSETMQSVRVFTFGGEGYPKSELKKLFDLYATKAKFINVYGPTEGTCICSSYEITEKDFEHLEGLSPLGEINSGFDYLILDEHGEPVEQGETGELCLLGPNVAMGYYNAVSRSDEAFIANPLRKEYRERMYLTGDLVHEDEDALLWFTGRKDNQIKHMGYRIELEEIENALNTLAFINQSAVIYDRVSTGFGKIIAFIATDEDMKESAIKRALEAALPHYMIPNIIHIEGHLPKNPNGKIDKALLKSRI